MMDWFLITFMCALINASFSLIQPVSIENKSISLMLLYNHILSSIYSASDHATNFGFFLKTIGKLIHFQGKQTIPFVLFVSRALLYKKTVSPWGAISFVKSRTLFHFFFYSNANKKLQEFSSFLYMTKICPEYLVPLTWMRVSVHIIITIHEAICMHIINIDNGYYFKQVYFLGKLQHWRYWLLSHLSIS